MEKRHTLIHDAAACRYRFDLDGGTACIDYTVEGDTLLLTRTFVPESHAGQGIAGELTEAVLRQVKADGRRIRPCCSYVARWLERHPEWQTLVDA